MDLYQENILDHYKNPRNGKPLSEYDIKINGSNPSCGDDLLLYLKLDGDHVTAIGYDMAGCAISTAALSLLSEKVVGMTKANILLLDRGDIDALLGVTVGPDREKCALLGLNTLQKAVQ